MATLPEELQYILEPARRYGDSRILSEESQDELLSELAPEDLRALAQTHARIVKQGDQSRLSIWRAENKTHADARKIIYLLHLFTLLHERGVPPFSQHLVCYDPTRPGADETLGFLPPDLKYLEEVAAAFEGLETIDDVYDAVEDPTPEQREIVDRYGAHVLRDKDRINNLVSTHDASRFPKIGPLMWAVSAVEELMSSQGD